MSDRIYRIRYLVEDWNKPVSPADLGGERMMEGATVSRSNCGYTDRLFVASILEDEGGDVDSVLMLDSKTQGPPDRAVLEMLKDLITHHLAEHCPPAGRSWCSPSRSNAIYTILNKVRRNARAGLPPGLTHPECLVLFDEMGRLDYENHTLRGEHGPARTGGPEGQAGEGQAEAGPGAGGVRSDHEGGVPPTGGSEDPPGSQGEAQGAGG